MPHTTKQERGTLTVYTGPMYAGKTTELIDTLREYDAYAAYKPALDDRYDDTRIVTHDDTAVTAHVVDTAAQLYHHVQDQDNEPDAVGIDDEDSSNLLAEGT